MDAFEVETKNRAMSVNKEIIVLLDHSKLNNVSLLKICETEEKLLNKFKANGIEVIIAK
ncbi:hypothetical protein L1S24_04460 [Clostridium sporogenes]|nr:hypothetical protein [Clostridium sporogenes]MCF4016395.1 hypothetical protein [Clostridium sporogenes]